jgi:hypothetical protein
MFGERKGLFTAILSNKIVLAIEAIPFNPLFSREWDELLNLSARARNCLRNADIVYLGHLVQMTEGELLRTPNFARKSLNEIKEGLAQIGLNLGMEVPGWPPENVQSPAKDEERIAFLHSEINAICRSLNDPWPSKVVALESAKNPIISDDDEKVSLYLKNLEMLWQLGTLPRQPQKSATLITAPAPPHRPTQAACH